MDRSVGSRGTTHHRQTNDQENETVSSGKEPEVAEVHTEILVPDGNGYIYRYTGSGELIGIDEE